MNASVNSTIQEIRNIDLPKLVLDEGYPLAESNHRWYGNTCPGCGEGSKQSNKFSVFVGKDGRWRFNCFSCPVYGDAADFLALARHITLADALAVLDGSSHLVAVKTSPAKKPTPSAATAQELQRVREVATILRNEAHDDRARAYLKERALSDATIDMAIESGQLRMLPTNPEGARRWLTKHVGLTLLREAGMLKGNSEWPALAFKPLLALEPGCFGFECRVASFEYEGAKAIRYGRMKWPWYFSHSQNPSTILVTEGIIDALSAWQSVPEGEAIMGVPGVNGWSQRWFAKIADLRPDTMILLGFDNDPAGEKASAYQADRDREQDTSLSAYLDSLGLKHSTFSPPLGKDWNEALKTRSIWL